MAAEDADTRTSTRWRSPELEHRPARGEGRRPPVEEEAVTGPGLVTLMRSLGEDTRVLVQQEVELARMEALTTAKRLAMDGIWLAAGLAIAALGGLVIVLGFALVIGYFLGSYWQGTLVVGGFIAMVGAVGTVIGITRFRSAKLKPTRTVASVRENAAWARKEADDLKRALKE